jgi:hypothetical protein
MTQSTSFDGRAMSGETFNTPFELFPGDHIITTCIYNTLDRSSDLIWGDSAGDREMCFGYVLYYPAITSMGGCFNCKGVHLVAGNAMG